MRKFFTKNSPEKKKYGSQPLTKPNVGYIIKRTVRKIDEKGKRRKKMLIENGQKIVFAGDSVTDDGRVRPIGEGGSAALGNGYVRLIDAYFSVDYPERFIHTVNMGISGNTSRDLAARWETDVNALNPDWVVMCIGFNDVWRQFDLPTIPESGVSPEEYRANLNKMADATKAKMIWMTPYYLEPNKEDAMRKRMDEYRAVMKEEAAKRGIPCIDLQEKFAHILKYRYPRLYHLGQDSSGRGGQRDYRAGIPQRNRF